MKYSFLVAALAIFVLTACEGKKSLDGHPMDKPPPSAFAPRDSEPVFDKSTTDEANVVKESDEADEQVIDDENQDNEE
ncbi:hypothetical protein SAMN05216419_102038 [Nitrosomonas cryotolerans]|uniref:Lipoprotein-attachment site-containing protein n=1 Tax=Nitrosomonas cryotolerans ATCC 49181 TaxID=1131553 RepID=A0A1N6H8U2_9PROT|nr:hypothetical protein [Nitrosomonas cryotolerans]SFP79961.1 hypothetical protein SAMN05216419_102038 [Nitrosomonas cryotolerans]SIO16183.1 hypothetical protein SAMN02743940_1078 [Nitrosomonas cryotolerans ATCC 49181]